MLTILTIFRDVRCLVLIRARGTNGSGAAANDSGPAWLVCFVSSIATACLLGFTHTAMVAGPLLVIAGSICLLVGIHWQYTRRRPEPVLAAAAGGLAVLIWAGAIAGTTALAALRTNAPLIDTVLANADAVLGLQTPPLVAWVASYPAAGLFLAFAYGSTVPLVFITAMVLACLRREAAMWELCFTFAVCGAFCAFVSALIPAYGAFSYYRSGPDIVSGLPAGAGNYYMPTFVAYRSGALASVNLFRLSGVVAFPSFHAAMAWMMAFALRGLGRISWLAWLWSGAIVVSAVPMGGHYGVDILAGTMLWMVATPSLRRRLNDGLSNADVAFQTTGAGRFGLRDQSRRRKR